MSCEVPTSSAFSIVQVLPSSSSACQCSSIPVSAGENSFHYANSVLCFSTEAETGYGYYIQAKVWLCFLEYSWNKITIAAERCCHRFLIRLKVQNFSVLWNHTLKFHGYMLRFISHAGIYAMVLSVLFLSYIWPLHLKWQSLLHLCFDVYIYPSCQLVLC